MAAQLEQIAGQALTEFELILPNQPAIPLSASLVTYLGSTLTETVYGAKSYSHRFTTVLPEFVNDLLRSAMVGATPRLRFRIGLGQPQTVMWLPWQEHIIINYPAIIEGVSKQAGHVLEINTSDVLFVIARVNKTVVRKGTISSIVQRIADENGVEAVIEPTNGEFLYIQSYIDDVQFIRQRMLPRATNNRGRGNYLFFVKDNVLHFHSPDYQSTIKELQYYQHAYRALHQIDRSQQLWDDGVSGTRTIVYDPYTGQIKEITSDPQKALRLSDGIYHLDSVKGAQRNIFYHLSSNRPEEAVYIGQNTYEQARMATYEVDLDLDKTLTYRMGDFIRLVISQQDSKTSPWSGLYFVVGTTSVIDQNAVTTKLLVKRGEIQRDMNNVVTQTANSQLVPEVEAPGQDLNIREAQTSVLTKGAGKQLSSNVFSTVVDANKAIV
jgi:hypothetical protein